MKNILTHFIFLLLFMSTSPHANEPNSALFLKAISDYTNNYLLNADILVAKGDQILFHQPFGLSNREANEPFTDRNLFQIASITKQFTAAAILLLQEQRKLDLHTPIIQYLTAEHFIWNGEVPSWANQVTIHQLLTHTSGIVDYSDEKFDNVDVMSNHDLIAHLISKIKNKPLLFSPGEKFDYCNTGYLLLSEIVNQLSNEKSLSLFLKNHFFQPLGMTSTYLPTVSQERAMLNQFNRIKDVPIRYIANLEDVNSSPIRMHEIHLNVPLVGAGAMISTMADLLKWNQGLYQGKILSAKSIKLMTTVHSSKLNSPWGDIKYGYGLIIENTDPDNVIFRHSGWIQGARSNLSFAPKTNTSVICLSNLSPDETQQNEMIRKQGKSFNDLALNLQQASIYQKLYSQSP